jgi:hypothetical protein
MALRLNYGIIIQLRHYSLVTALQPNYSITTFAF